MRIILKRVLLSMKGNIVKSSIMITCIFAITISLGVTGSYWSAKNFYIETLNAKYPATIYLLNKDVISENTVDHIGDELIALVRENKNVSNIIQNDDLTYLEFTLISHKCIEETLLELNRQIQDKPNYVFSDATNYNITQLLKSIEIANNQLIVIVTSFIVTILIFFFILQHDFINLFNKDAIILKRIGESNNNIALQFLFLELLIGFPTIALGTVISLLISNRISRLWIEKSTSDFNDGLSITNFSEQNELFLATENTQILTYMFGMIFLFIFLYLIFLMVYYIYFFIKYK